MRYPTPISDLLGFRIVDTGEETTPVRAEVEAALHGNQQGTVHGGFLSRARRYGDWDGPLDPRGDR
jgi:acyl-coenzyme A thioesterase PaaI-like protein